MSLRACFEDIRHFNAGSKKIDGEGAAFDSAKAHNNYRSSRFSTLTVRFVIYQGKIKRTAQ
jgi:hypothetical protein